MKDLFSKNDAVLFSSSLPGGGLLRGTELPPRAEPPSGAVPSLRLAQLAAPLRRERLQLDGLHLG